MITVSLFLVLSGVGISPHGILRIIELQGVLKLPVKLRLYIFINLEQTQLLGVVQELKADNLALIDTSNTFKTDYGSPA